MRLTAITDIRGEIEVLTGLRIGAGDLGMRIGGVDNTIIRNPRDDRPYIPGSSLKGKVRSLLEWRSGAVRSEPLTKADWEKAQGDTRQRVEAILKLFGVSGDVDAKDNPFLITRAGFQDATLIPDAPGSNLPIVEVKSENMIDRIRGVAKHPRQTERVAAGVRFNFRVTVKVLDEDPDLTATLLEGLRLLELDGLGGSVSRGYGKIRFRELTRDGKPIQDLFEAIEPFAPAA